MLSSPLRLARRVAIPYGAAAPTIDNATGANFWYNPTRILTFVVKGTQDVRLRTRDAVMASATLVLTQVRIGPRCEYMLSSPL
eukprot:4271939-Pyramimonas_sp.AAC.1